MQDSHQWSFTPNRTEGIFDGQKSVKKLHTATPVAVEGPDNYNQKQKNNQKDEEDKSNGESASQS